MKPLFLAFFFTSMLLAAARAGDDPPAIELKQKSTFDAAPADRDPFWPIGWKKPGPKATSAGPGPELTPGAFSLTSVTTGTGPHFAILNGKVMQEGQQFGLQFGNQVYNLTVKAIEDGQVVLVYQETEIVVPLHRH